MRRTLIAAAALATTAGLAAAVPTTASAALAVPTAKVTTGTVLAGAPFQPDGRVGVPSSPSSQADRAADALAEAEDALAGNAGGQADADEEEKVDATLALLEVFRTRDELSGDERKRADDLLLRPTNNANDPFGGGYTVKSKKKCNSRLCVHWVPSTKHKATKKWAKTSLKVSGRAWRLMTGKLGYTEPPHDGKRGGNKKLDIYLKDTGASGVYGYCSPEGIRGRRDKAFGYCVLDNDFARSQFPTNSPKANLKVTAVHELFHAIQFGYDVYEDRWLYESTAVWMEERFADGVNDNRQYLRYSQVTQPFVPLDLSPNSSTPGFWYGNWAFWEYLSERKGNGIVKKVWNRAADGPGKNLHSVAALENALGASGFRKTFAGYAAALARPAANWQEGKHWPKPDISTVTLSRAASSRSFSGQLDHLASDTIRFRPGSSVTKLRVNAKSLSKKKGGAVVITVARKNGTTKKYVLGNDKGKASKQVPFSSGKVSAVDVTLVNGGTAYRNCGSGTAWACGGYSKRDNATAKVTAKAG